MSLKQKFSTQSILILVGTIIITFYVGFLYSYFYNLFNKSPGGSGLGKTPIIVIENDSILFGNEDFSSIQIKEILMNISMNKNQYEYENTKYLINEENFTSPNGHEYKMITLNSTTSADDYYKTLIMLVFLTFLIAFILASIIVQRQNMKNIITPITNLTKEMEKLRLGELDTAITDQGYGEVRELGSTVEQLRLQLKDSVYYRQKVDDNRKFLISSISHDLKTPVTSIRGYIDGVLDGVANTEEKKDYYLKKAVEKTNMINVMIEDLLLYSKLDLKQMPFEKEMVSIEKFIESCMEDHSEEFRLENKKLIFENELSNPVFIIIDVEKFKRVIQNILDNAKKSIEEQRGELKIILRETNSSLIIEFKDNGKGISKEDLPNVFERFYRVDIAREAKGSSGLGLAISKQIVEGLGGRIWAISEIGQGASFIISLRKVNHEEVIR